MPMIAELWKIDGEMWARVPVTEGTGRIQILSDAEIAANDEKIGRLFSKIEGLQAAIEPFATIGLDVLKNHPGWANAVFEGEWCGYRLTYVQFEAAAAATIASRTHEQSAHGDSK